MGSGLAYGTETLAQVESIVASVPRGAFRGIGAPLKASYIIVQRCFPHYGLNFHSWLMLILIKTSLSGSADWPVVGGDVPAGSADRLPLCGAGLLEGPAARRGALHHPRVHHDD